MRIIRIATIVDAHDMESLYGHMKDALKNLGMNFIGKTKNDIRNAIKELEELRPHLKNKGVR
jgi:hypothetical protein